MGIVAIKGRSLYVGVNQFECRKIHRKMDFCISVSSQYCQDVENTLEINLAALAHYAYLKSENHLSVLTITRTWH